MLMLCTNSSVSESSHAANRDLRVLLLIMVESGDGGIKNVFADPGKYVSSLSGEKSTG
jgi:hypothetical protein